VSDGPKQPSLTGLVLLEPPVYEDERGHFFERFNHARFSEAVGRETDFVQDNQSRSVSGVLRGLHYQVAPAPQGKLVSCIAGEVFDVAVDIRRSSSTFGQWFGVVLSAENRQQLWIPEGFAHGFLAVTEGAELLYKTTDYYDPTAERSIMWNDPAIGISWPIEGGDPLVSPKDAAAPLLADAEVFD
jgi:dTDP-4-dehydrorhamnose 3,5-epimerase